MQLAAAVLRSLFGEAEAVQGLFKALPAAFGMRDTHPHYYQVPSLE